MLKRNREELVNVALGNLSPDVVIVGGNLVNVYTHEIYPADIIIKGERVAAVIESGQNTYDDCVNIDARGKFITPGFIDPHVHIESSAVTVQEFAKSVVPRGITSVAEDPHEIANVLGVKGIRLFFEEAKTVPLNLLLRVPGRVPGMEPHLETSGGAISFKETCELLEWDEAVCLAGDINPNIVLNKDNTHYKKFDFTEQIRKTISGQSPGLTGGVLNAFIAAGPEDSHVSENTKEIIDITRHGMRSLITHRPDFFGKKDYQELAQAIENNHLDTRLLLFCTDDIQPYVLLENGHLDERLRFAIEQGINPVTAIQMATINVADYFRIDRDYGSITPGKFADILIMDNLETVRVDKVLVHGKVAAIDGELAEQVERFYYPDWAKNTVHVPHTIGPDDFKVRVIEEFGKATVRAIIPGMPKREASVSLKVDKGVVLPDVEHDVLCVAVIDRHSNNGAIGNGFVTGYGIKDGAVASSVNHDAHNIVIIGSNYDDMAVAANHLIDLRGGIVVVKNSEVIADVALPIAGIISDVSIEETAQKFKIIEEVLLEELHCALKPHPLYEINFLCLPNIPNLGITDKGLIDSNLMEIIDVVTKVE